MRNEKVRRQPKGWFERDHFAWIFKPGHIDAAFAVTTIIILTFGLIMMFSASVASGTKLFRSQLVFAIAGLALMFVASQIDMEKIENAFRGYLPLVMYGLGIALLLAAFVFTGDTKAGYHRIFKLGPIQFQPSEFVKVALIILLAKVLTVSQAKLLKNDPVRFRRFSVPAKTVFGEAYRAIVNFFIQRDLPVMIILLVIIGIPALIVKFSNHNSGMIILLLIGMCMMFSGNVKFRYFGVVLTVAAVVLIAGFAIYKSSPEFFSKHLDSKGRITAWLSHDYTSHEQNRWQVNNGLYAIGSGGFFGVGFNKSVQKYYYVPEPQNDMIFSILCEEFGFFGAFLVLFAFALYLCLCANIARKSRSKFQKFIVYGIMAHIGLQVSMNVAVVTEVMPLTGVELPFFSSGGSALLANLIESGIVLAVSKSNPAPRAAR
ncbi:MAG: FtsW/RodA/SpoVE family cell cycle protein [Clostridia bacterium]|nr:FtsW/RodA/SpoVE family cell cycle protein [Clostridia bacterium]